MNLTDALMLCKTLGKPVRPWCWQWTNPNHWVIYRAGHFVEHGAMEEIPHALRLSTGEEFFGEWEAVK